MLTTVRVLVSAPWPEGNDGRYYWMHCCYVNTTDWSTEGQMALAVLQDMSLLYTEQVLIHSIRWKLPGTNTIFYEQIYSTPVPGSQAPQDNFNLLIAARWRMRGSDGSYSYHLHRQPVGEGYLESGGWSSTGFTQQQTRLNTFIAQGIYRTASGSLIASGTVVAKPAMWQLRHGTKRRRRRFWLP